MHLLVNALFDLELGVKVTQNFAKCPLHHVTYGPAKFEVATSNGLGSLGGDTFFDLLRVKVKQNGPSTLSSCDLCTCKL